jgi:hypothetical protein
MKLKAKDKKLIIKTVEDCDHLLIKLLIECWNAESPHFGGAMPHRYDGIEKTCSYCTRPKDWKPVNAGYYAGQILYGEEAS